MDLVAKEPSRDPKAPERVLILTKAEVAQSQLETAIRLWFRYDDPMSIHTLAAAANKCYHGMGSKSGHPTLTETWKKSLSKKDYDIVSRTENFAKHANTDASGETWLLTAQTEILILDSVVCHEKIFKSKTPLMSCFFARYTFENPRLIEHFLTPRWRENFLKGIDVHNLGKGSRVDYLNEVLPSLFVGLSPLENF